MIATDTYPELDEAHIDALFAASRQAVADAHAAIAKTVAGGSALGLADDVALYRFLPRKYLPRYNAEFAQRFAATVSTVVWKLAEPNHTYSLACTAEDLALKCILDLAKAILGRGGDDDAQYEELVGALLEDEAFLVLWDPAQNGGEDRYPGAANLAFTDWFVPFSDREQVHPFVQDDSQGFRSLWSDVETVEDDLEDPTTEVFIALGEDWLEVPDQVADQIPAILDDSRAALVPDRASRRLSGTERQRVYDSAAEDVHVLLDAARKDIDQAYDVWLVTQGGPGGPNTRQRLHAGLPLEEALSLRKLERMGEYRGVADVELRVYPEGHTFEADAGGAVSL
jgi:hypothetical protein